MFTANPLFSAAQQIQIIIMARSETQEQISLITWARKLSIPIFSIPNQRRSSDINGKILKMSGLIAGACDLFLSVPNKSYSGFFIEMKKKGFEPSHKQHAFMNLMRENGYKAEWYDDWEKARDSIIDYLDGVKFTKILFDLFDDIKQDNLDIIR